MNKRSLIFLFALFVGVAVMAQSVSFDLKPEGKGTARDDTPQFIGCDGQRIVLVESSGRLARNLSLAAYSVDQQELARVELGKQKEINSYGGFINGQHVDLLMASFPEDSKTGRISMNVYRDRRSLATLAREGDTMPLGSYVGEKGDDFGFGIASSPNGQLLAGVFVANYKGQGSEVKVGLYNRELEEYWTMTLQHANFNSISVSDDGDILLYTLGEVNRHIFFGYDGECHFTIVDGEHIKSADFRLDSVNKIYGCEFVRYGNGKIIVAAVVREEDYSVMPIGSNVDRVDIYCYDVDKHRLTAERRTFTDQEVHRLTNEKEGKSPKHHWVQFGQIAQTLSDKSGGYVVIDQMWSVSVNGAKTEQHRSGIMVMRIDENGKIMWTRARRFVAGTSWNERHFLTHRWTYTPDGIVLAWVDNAANMEYPPEKPFKEYKPTRTKNTLNVWTLTPDGKEGRGAATAGYGCLMGAVHRLDTPGKYVALLSVKRKGQLAFITLKEH